jgi:hypothetical protein
MGSNSSSPKAQRNGYRVVASSTTTPAHIRFRERSRSPPPPPYFLHDFEGGRDGKGEDGGEGNEWPFMDVPFPFPLSVNVYHP